MASCATLTTASASWSRPKSPTRRSRELYPPGCAVSRPTSSCRLADAHPKPERSPRSFGRRLLGDPERQGVPVPALNHSPDSSWATEAASGVARRRSPRFRTGRTLSPSMSRPRSAGVLEPRRRPGFPPSWFRRVVRPPEFLGRSRARFWAAQRRRSGDADCRGCPAPTAGRAGRALAQRLDEMLGQPLSGDRAALKRPRLRTTKRRDGRHSEDPRPARAGRRRDQSRKPRQSGGRAGRAEVASARLAKLLVKVHNEAQAAPLRCQSPHAAVSRFER